MSKHQNAILKFLRDHVGQQFTPCHIADVLYDKKPRPKHWRGGVLAILRTMKFRLDYCEDVTFERISRLGVSSLAVFVAKKNTRKIDS
jgi:hypothetical protein